jgi:hypothetical protein
MDRHRRLTRAEKKIVTRNEALRRRLTRFFTGKPCPLGHVAERNVSNGSCVTCSRLRDQARYVANLKRERARSRIYRAAHPEAVRAASRAWYATNLDRVAASMARGHAKRRSPGCVPPEFNLEETIPFYAEARRRTRETGVLYVVDHIIALCLDGKHIASNLQVLTEAANLEKAKAERADAKRK